MCSAWTIMRPALVEEGGRAVAPLLDVRREGRADERRAHLLGDSAELRAENLELNIHVSRHPERGIPIPNPHPPGGNPAGGAVELEDGRASDLERLARPGTRIAGPGAISAVRTATSSTARSAVRDAVALLVRPVEALREVRRRAARSARTTGPR